MNRREGLLTAQRALRMAEAETIAEGLDDAAGSDSGLSFFSGRRQHICSLSYRDIREQAIDLAHRFASLKIKRLSRIAVIGETSPDFLRLFFACQYAGLVPVPLPLNINLGAREAYCARLESMISAARAALVVGPPDLLPVLRDAAASSAAPVGTMAYLMAAPQSRANPLPLQRNEPCYIQYSSGSTRRPCGVLITQKSLTHNARAIGRHGLKLRQGDRATSWLPFYHDMGLVGFCLTPMLGQVPVDYLAPTDFARRPLNWLMLLSERGGTISFSPTSGYDLCLRRAVNGFDEGLDLSRWRVAGVGGEMVRPDVLQRFADRFSSQGFSGRAFMPSYGLAEATLAVTFAPVDSGVEEDTVDLGVLALKGRAEPVRRRDQEDGATSRTFVMCGKVLPGHRIEVRDEHGRALPDRMVGSICVDGPSVMAGYFNDPEATRAAIGEDGWLDTGDLGYSVDGNLVVTGRSKDLIIWNGRNVWPQDIEWAVEKLEGVGGGAVAAFTVGEDDRADEVVLVVQSRCRNEAARSALRKSVAAAAYTTAGVQCRVVLAPPRSLAFTSSGKLSRAATRARYLTGAIRDVAERNSGGGGASKVSARGEGEHTGSSAGIACHPARGE